MLNPDVVAPDFHHDIPFDPTYGYSLRDLLAVAVPGEPAGFELFWSDLYRRAMAVEVEPQRLREESGSAKNRVWEIRYRSLGGVENRISLAGHTDAKPYGSGDRGYSNWELSADRANASRRELVAGGLPDDKLRRVEGLAASVPLLPEQPLDASNRRISIVIMTRDYEERMFPPALPAAPVLGRVAPEPPVLSEAPAAALQISADLTKTSETSTR